LIRNWMSLESCLNPLNKKGLIFYFPSIFYKCYGRRVTCESNCKILYAVTRVSRHVDLSRHKS
ncbi:MAG: hypothetical protein ACPLZG_12725, partial [Thermoproteota archaeon]